MLRGSCDGRISIFLPSCKHVLCPMNYTSRPRNSTLIHIIYIIILHYILLHYKSRAQRKILFLKSAVIFKLHPVNLNRSTIRSIVSLGPQRQDSREDCCLVHTQPGITSTGVIPEHRGYGQRGWGMLFLSQENEEKQ